MEPLFSTFKTITLNLSCDFKFQERRGMVEVERYHFVLHMSTLKIFVASWYKFLVWILQNDNDYDDLHVGSNKR